MSRWNNLGLRKSWMRLGNKGLEKGSKLNLKLLI